jgi:hypothetical protein
MDGYCPDTISRYRAKYNINHLNAIVIFKLQSQNRYLSCKSVNYSFGVPVC